jgi:hypothetical protein
MFKLFIYFFVVMLSHNSYADCSIPGWPNCSIEDSHRALDRRHQQNLQQQQQQQLLQFQQQQLNELQRQNQLTEKLIQQQQDQIRLPSLNCRQVYDRLGSYERCN